MAGMDMGKKDVATPGMARDDKMQGMSMSGMDMKMRDFSNAPKIEKNPGVQTVAMSPVDRTSEPGQVLENVGHRVLVYRDLMALARNAGLDVDRFVADVRRPVRSTST